MGTIDDLVLQDLIGCIYEAAIEPERWPDFMKTFGHAISAEGVVLWLHDFKDGSADFNGNGASLACFTGFDPTAIGDYAAHYSEVNVWAQNEDKLQSGSAVTSSMLYPDADLIKTEYYNDWLKPQDLFYSLGGVVEKQDTLSVKFSALRSSYSGAYSNIELSLYQILVPHLQRAVSLHRRLAQTRLPGQSALASLDFLPTAVWLLGAVGELLYANPAAERLAQQGDVMTQSANGRPRARVSSEDKRLQRLITLALQTGLGEGREAGGSQMMWGNNGSGMLHVMVTPLASGHNGFGMASAAVFATTPNNLPHDFECKLRQLYTLTPAESRMVAALVGGESVVEFSERTAISAATARTHLKHILAKTITRRQSDLVRLVMTGPAMLGR